MLGLFSSPTSIKQNAEKSRQNAFEYNIERQKQLKVYQNNILNEIYYFIQCASKLNGKYEYQYSLSHLYHPELPTVMPEEIKSTKDYNFVFHGTSKPKHLSYQECVEMVEPIEKDISLYGYKVSKVFSCNHHVRIIINWEPENCTVIVDEEKNELDSKKE